jgi:GTPase SAR1 family protein
LWFVVFVVCCLYISLTPVCKQDDQFSTNFTPTIGVDFKVKTMMFNQKQVKLQLWDTAGQERFRAITRAYYKGADGIFIIYDVTYPPSFYHVKDWLEDIHRYGFTRNVCVSRFVRTHGKFGGRYSPKRAVMMMVGNKSDMKRAVDPAAAQVWFPLVIW